MKIFGKKRTSDISKSLHASSADFCRIFESDMDRLYMLSLLLTADAGLAEKCFVGGLEDSKNSNPVFKEWAHSWARRTVIINATRTIGPRPGIRESVAQNFTGKSIDGLPEEFMAVVNLPAFERFVFVMAVLERYSARDCRLLLNCSNFDVAQARVQALQQLEKPVQGLAEFNVGETQGDNESSGTRLPSGLVEQFAA
jgi:DNA-directed RNA polymerase specialized sigma24 family protein